MSSISTPTTASPHVSPRLSNDLSQLQSAISQMNVSDQRNPSNEQRHREAQMLYIQQQQRYDPSDGNRSRIGSDSAPERDSGYSTAREPPGYPSSINMGYPSNANPNNNSYRTMASPRESQESYQQHMLSPRDIPDSYGQVLSPRSQDRGLTPLLGSPTHQQRYDVNHMSTSPSSGLKPLVPPLKPLVPPINNMSSHHHLHQHQQMKQSLEIQVDYGQGLQQFGGLNSPSSVFPPTQQSLSYRSPISQQAQSSSLNSSAAPFLPSLNSPPMRSSTASTPMSNKKPSSISGMDFGSLERLNGNQFTQHDGQAYHDHHVDTHVNRLNMSPGGSLSNRISHSQSYPYSSMQESSTGYPPLSPQKYSSSPGNPNALLAPLPLGFRTGSETNLLAVEIAESILSSSLTPELNPKRKDSFSSTGSYSRQSNPILSPIGVAEEESTADRNISPRRLGRTNSASTSQEISRALPGELSHRHASLNGVVVGGGGGVVSATPRDFSPRITDGWITGRIVEDISPRSPPFSDFPSSLHHPHQADSSPDNEDYPFYDAKDEDSDADSTTDEAEQFGSIPYLRREEGVTSEKAMQHSSVTLPFKYESNFYQ
jgi:hypothetical protein